MAGNLKKIFIIGHLGSDPVMRYTSDGTAVASFSVAVSERNRRPQGSEGGTGAQQEEVTTWFRVSAWRRQAEISNDLLKKGMAVFVSGDLKTREFVGNDGQKRFSLDVTMDDMQILTPKGVTEGGSSFDESPAFGGPGPSKAPTPFGGRSSGGRPQTPDADDQDDSDIPF
jgi:single-strand DNA-binding protein